MYSANSKEREGGNEGRTEPEGRKKGMKKGRKEGLNETVAYHAQSAALERR